MMDEFAATNCLTVAGNDSDIVAGTGTVEDTSRILRTYYHEYGYLLDPHTAVGVAVAEKHLSRNEPTVCLATAHPAKFPAAIRDAIGTDIARHATLDRLAGLPTRCTVLPATRTAIQTFIQDALN